LVPDNEQAAIALQSRATSPPDRASAWQSLFWTVFNRSRNPMAIIDRERRYVEVNPCHTKVFGRSRDEIVGTLVDDYLPPDELATIAAEYEAFTRDGEFNNERSYITSDGRVVRVQYAVATERITGHDLAFFVSHVVDAADEQESEEQPSAGHDGESLSPREREVVQHVALGMTSRQIAEELSVSTETVRTHIRNALAKTGTRTRAQLVAQVMGSGSLVID
jgi:PAS domain S-box-containing protein